MRPHFAARGALVAAALCAAALVAPAPALAHVPVLEPSRSSDASGTAGDPYPDAVGMQAPEASLALYGYLAAGEAFDVYTFEADTGVSTDASILVPVEAGEGFRPTLLVSVLAPDGARTVAEAGSPRERSTFFEPFTLQTLYEGDRAPVTLEAGERYYLRVVPGPGEQRTGAYVVAFSGAERFTAGEGLRTLVYVPRIMMGLYGQAPFDPVPLVVAAFVLVAVVAAVVLLLRRRRSKARGPLEGNR